MKNKYIILPSAMPIQIGYHSKTGTMVVYSYIKGITRLESLEGWIESGFVTVGGHGTKSVWRTCINRDQPTAWRTLVNLNKQYIIWEELICT